MEDLTARLSVCLLADHPHLVEEVGRMRWRQWGKPPEPIDEQTWIEVTRREADRAGLPLTLVAVDKGGMAVGAIGLGESDLAERPGLSPWVLGLIVRPEQRKRGVGRLLVLELERLSAQRGYSRLWVANEGQAVGFYRGCGWTEVEKVQMASGPMATVLSKDLSMARQNG